MPQRFLKPGLISSQNWEQCSWLGQSFYVRLIPLVDDFGRYEAAPALLRSHAFPLREDIRTAQVSVLCREIAGAQLACFYKASDGKVYLQLNKWTEKPRAVESKYPAFDSTCEQMFADVCRCWPSSSPSSSPPPSSSASSRSPNSPSCKQVLAEPADDPNRWPEGKKPPQKPPEASGRQAVTRERIVIIHEWYCMMTSEQPLTQTVERQWYEFLKLYHEDDFKRAFSYLRNQIAAEKRNPGALKLSNILQVDKFPEDLALAKTNMRKPMPQRPTEEQPKPNAAGKAQLPKLTQAMREAVEKGEK
jgi:hypothetical protein